MITISLNGTDYEVPSAASDTNWAAKQVAWEQAVSAAATYAVRQLSTNVTPVGTGADTTEDNLMTYSLPASTLSADGMGVRVTAFGAGANTSDVTTLRAYFGASALTGAGLVLTASQANTWRVVFEVWRTAAATQTGSLLFANGGVASSLKVVTLAPTETLSSAVTIKFTGQRASSSVANSVQQLGMTVELLPRPA